MDAAQTLGNSPIRIGDLAYGSDVTLVKPTQGAVKAILVYVGLDRWVPLGDATETQAHHAARRYTIICADGRERTIDGARLMSMEPLTWLVTSYRAMLAGDPGRGALRRAVLECAGRALGPSGRRDIVVGKIEMSIAAVVGGGLYRVNVRRDGELLLAQSGTWNTDRKALRSFATTLITAINL